MHSAARWLDLGASGNGRHGFRNGTDDFHAMLLLVVGELGRRGKDYFGCPVGPGRYGGTVGIELGWRGHEEVARLLLGVGLEGWRQLGQAHRMPGQDVMIHAFVAGRAMNLLLILLLDGVELLVLLELMMMQVHVVHVVMLVLVVLLLLLLHLVRGHIVRLMLVLLHLDVNDLLGQRLLQLGMYRALLLLLLHLCCGVLVLEMVDVVILVFTRCIIDWHPWNFLVGAHTTGTVVTILYMGLSLEH